MNILMLTNTYTPHVGGVARSVKAFAEEHRRRGHRVLVAAPEFEGLPADESPEEVVRVPALQNFNGSDFSAPAPASPALARRVEEFQPDIVHAHHPFLLGDSALRIAARRALPIVFTHHTMYEQYTHYVPGDSELLKRFVMELATGYANLCHAVIAPSESIAVVLSERGVETPIHAIPTGVDANRFAQGDGAALRRRLGVAGDAFVVGHLGRLAPEKNLAFLARAVSEYLKRDEKAVFLVVGEGPASSGVERLFAARGLADRLFMPGKFAGQDLVDAYHAMDVFAFASKSETQGMVLTEAMAAGVPVTALDAPGARDVLRDGENGRLLHAEDESAFATALDWARTLAPDGRQELAAELRRTAEAFSTEACANRALELYAEVLAAHESNREVDDSAWSAALRRIEEEWKIWANVAAAGVAAVDADSN